MYDKNSLEHDVLTIQRDGMSPVGQMGMRAGAQYTQMRMGAYTSQQQQSGITQQRWTAAQQQATQQQQQARMSVQQLNPMLNAQLSVRSFLIDVLRL